MPSWLTIVLALGGSACINFWVVFFFNHVINSKKAREERNRELAEAVYQRDEASRKGIQLLLKKELKRIHKGCTRKGYATLDEKHEFEETYQVYHALGQNGVMDNAREEMMHLPTEKPNNSRSTRRN